MYLPFWNTPHLFAGVHMFNLICQFNFYLASELWFGQGLWVCFYYYSNLSVNFTFLFFTISSNCCPIFLTWSSSSAKIFDINLGSMDIRVIAENIYDTVHSNFVLRYWNFYILNILRVIWMEKTRIDTQCSFNQVCKAFHSSYTNKLKTIFLVI